MTKYIPRKDLKDWSIADLNALLSYQNRPGEHTIGTCSTKNCGRHSRGGGICRECLKSELEARKV